MATRAAPIGVRALTGCPPVGMVPPTMEESDAVSRRRPEAFGQAAMRGPFECRVRYYRCRLGAGGALRASLSGLVRRARRGCPAVSTAREARECRGNRERRNGVSFGKRVATGPLRPGL